MKGVPIYKSLVCLMLHYIFIGFAVGLPVRSTSPDIEESSHDSLLAFDSPFISHSRHFLSSFGSRDDILDSHYAMPSENQFSAWRRPVILDGIPVDHASSRSFEAAPFSHPVGPWNSNVKGKEIAIPQNQAHNFKEWRYLASLNENHNPTILNSLATSNLMHESHKEKEKFSLQADTNLDDDAHRYYAALYNYNNGRHGLVEGISHEQIPSSLVEERQEQERQIVRKYAFNEAWDRLAMDTIQSPQELAKAVFTMKVDGLGERTIRMLASNKVKLKENEHFELQYLNRMRDMTVQFREILKSLRGDVDLYKLNAKQIDYVTDQAVKKADILQEKRKRLSVKSSTSRLSDNEELNAVGTLVRTHLNEKKKCFFNISLEELERHTRDLGIKGMSKNVFSRHLHDFLNRARIISEDEMAAFKHNRKNYIDAKRRKDEKEKALNLMQAHDDDDECH